MGLPLLIERLQEIRKNQPAATKSGLLNVASFVCLDEFLKILAVNLNVLTEFKTMLNGLIVTASEQISILNVIIAQMETALSILQTFYNTFHSTYNSLTSRLTVFPFDDPNYLQCPPIQVIKNYVTKMIPLPDPASTLPGNTGRYAKKYRQTTQAFKELEFRIFRYQKKINKLRKKVAEIQIQILAWQAIVDAIGQQFGV